MIIEGAVTDFCRCSMGDFMVEIDGVRHWTFIYFDKQFPFRKGDRVRGEYSEDVPTHRVNYGRGEASMAAPRLLTSLEKAAVLV